MLDWKTQLSTELGLDVKIVATIPKSYHKEFDNHNQNKRSAYVKMIGEFMLKKFNYDEYELLKTSGYKMLYILRNN